MLQDFSTGCGIIKYYRTSGGAQRKPVNETERIQVNRDCPILRGLPECYLHLCGFKIPTGGTGIDHFRMGVPRILSEVDEVRKNR